jgi:DNA-binding transcriptional MerR regulator
VAWLSIGELARRTGLTVKTIRSYSDRGIVPPAGRTPAGYRRYGEDAVARLALVRTLRELGLGLDTIRRIVTRDVSLARVAAAQVDALDVQIRLLYLRRAVLAVAARNGTDGEETMVVHALATLSAAERRRLVDDFLDGVFAGVAGRAEFAGMRRSLTPELPDDATARQIEAWVELASLAGDPDFRAAMGRLTTAYAAQHRDVPTRDVVAVVRAEARPAVSAGVDPGSGTAGRVVATVVARYADALGEPDDPDLRRRLLAYLRAVDDPRRRRYLRMLSVVNGWPDGDEGAAELDWFTRALRARLAA